MAGYPTYDELVSDRRRALRAVALRAVRHADAKVRAAGGRLVVFGSLAEGGFDDRSDIDLAILGVAAGADERLAVEIDTDLGRAGFPCDVIPERFLTPSLRERIERHGREPSTLG
ncbi:MAG: nucleotidyltransferase domain-containing protein [Alphaproteobacteria bacterium]|nr:nucleotidyltransferase domain-containing protein [Alphaproteobacteria bacterium]